jgi:HAD superfamily hydrolase (TIGR01549 family)
MNSNSQSAARGPAIAVVFDVEGTLMDCRTLLLESWRETLKKAGHTVTHRDLQPFFGMDGLWMLEQLLPSEPQSMRERLVKAQGERYRRGFLRRAPAFAGVRDLIQTLHNENVLIGIATTCQKEELALYEQQMRVLDLVDAVACGETVEHGKPDPALLRQCLNAMNVTEDAGLVLAVGDTPYDAQAAKAIGVQAVGVLTGGFSARELEKAGCDHVFPQVRQIGQLWRVHGKRQLAAPAESVETAFQPAHEKHHR